MKTIQLWFSGVVLAPLLLACNSGGGGGGGTFGEGGSGGSGSPSDEACVTCAQNNCSVELQSCADNPACGAIAQCIDGCSGYDCLDSCSGQYPEGASAFENAVNCISIICADECGASGAGGASSGGAGGSGSGGSGGTEDECDSDGDCGSSQICSYGECKSVQCKYDSDCGSCSRCSSNSCYDCGSGPYGCYC